MNDPRITPRSLHISFNGEPNRPRVNGIVRCVVVILAAFASYAPAFAQEFTNPSVAEAELNSPGDMASDEESDFGWVDPEKWTIVDDKLYLNLHPEVRRRWSEDIPGYIEKADAHWSDIKDKDPAEVNKF